MSEVSEQLLEVLASLDEASQFCTSGSVASVLPGLEVQGVGEVGLPIGPAVAQQLIQQAEPAPYGRGEETIVDLNVRRVWQIEPKRCTLNNPEWDVCLSEIVETVKQEFGIDKRVTWDLYKLLIYDKGSFFAPHRDSEKVDGMFATLLVCLPSQHKGGSLVVSHDGESKAIDFDTKAGAFNIQYAAFYTDCQHEIRPVTSGYRVCFVYNLKIAKSKRQPSAPVHRDAVEQTVSLLSTLFSDSQQNKIDKIAIPLAHEYSQAGLSPDMLKGTDRSCVDVLVRAAERLGYQLHLALMTHHQSGSVEDEGWGYDDRWSSNDDDAEMGEIYEESLSLDYWIDAQGKEKAFGEMQLDPDEVLGESDFDGSSATQEVHEATGNEGVSMERWYRRGVVVVWPEDRYFRILAGEGQSSALPGLAELIEGESDPSHSEACRTFATEIINRWRLPTSVYARRDSSQSVDMLSQLERLADPGLVNRFIHEILAKDCTGTEGPLLSGLCDKLGWQTFAQALTDFVTSQVPSQPTASLTATVSIFKDLCCSASSSSSSSSRITAKRQATCRAMAGELQQVITSWDSHKEKNVWLRQSESREGIVEAVFQALCAIKEPAVLEQFLSHALTTPKHYGLHTVLIPAVQQLHQQLDRKSPGRESYRRLLTHCLDGLQALTKTPVPVPTDWAQNIKIKCTCDDCAELQHFLRDPQEQVHRFRVRKDRRQHLHQQINAHGCDVDHVTDRRGSPQTLVCTKNRASYERKQQQFETDTRLLAELRVIAEASA